MHVQQYIEENVGEGNLHTTQIKLFETKGDGNCFFHAVFGTLNNSSNQYETEKAQDMRKEWHRFLSQFTSLKDPKMPQALKEYFLNKVFEAFIHGELSKELKSVLSSAFEKSNAVKTAYEKAKKGAVEDQKSFFSMSELYEAYSDAIKGQSYFISTEEILVLASLANITIHMYVSRQGPTQEKNVAYEQVFTPDSEIVEGYKRNEELWGKSSKIAVFHQGMHYSRLPNDILGLSQCSIVTPGGIRFPFKSIENTIQENKQRGTSHSKSPGKENTPPGPSRRRQGSLGENNTTPESKDCKKNCPSKRNPDSDKCLLDENFRETLTGKNCTNLLRNFVIDDIAKHVFGWDEKVNDVIFGIEGHSALSKKLNEFKKNKGKTLIYIVNKNGNHWVTLVAIHDNRQEDIFFYADSFGEEIEKCTVNGLGRGDTDSNTQNKVSYGNKVNQYSVDRNRETAPLKQDRNDNIRMSLDKFLKKQGYSENNIHSVSCKQQNDNYNCGVFALKNAEAILNVVKDGNGDTAKVKGSLERVKKDLESLNTLRRNFAKVLKEISNSAADKEAVKKRFTEKSQNLFSDLGNLLKSNCRTSRLKTIIEKFVKEHTKGNNFLSRYRLTSQQKNYKNCSSYIKKYFQLCSGTQIIVS